MLFRFALALLKCNERYVFFVACRAEPTEISAVLCCRHRTSNRYFSCCISCPKMLQMSTLSLRFVVLAAPSPLMRIPQQAYDPIWMGSFPRTKIVKGREAIMETLQHEKRRFIEEAQQHSASAPQLSPRLSPRVGHISVPVSPRGTGPSISPRSSPNLLAVDVAQRLTPASRSSGSGLPRYLGGDEVAILAGAPSSASYYTYNAFTERQLSDSELVYVAAELERDVTAHQLILDGNAFGADGIHALGKALSRNITLTKLLVNRASFPPYTTLE